MSGFKNDEILKKYDFRWDVLDVVIGGKSMIDSEAGFHMRDMEDVENFIRSYGYDVDDPIEKAEIFGNFHEAINFIRRFFLKPDNPDGLELEVPRKILELSDIGDLLLMASLNYPGQTAGDSEGMLLQRWSCALLKVMHAITHIDNDPRSSYYTAVQKQILDRFYKVIQRDEEGRLFLGEKDDLLRVDLVAFETKPRKSRESLLLKLLHKPEVVAEDIFDMVGLRFVTPTRLDSLRVVKFLKDHRIIVPANVKPSRSRNTLVDVELFKSEMERMVGAGYFSERELEGTLSQTSQAGGVQDNPHSSHTYRSIQFTCRQLIKLKNPLYSDLKKLKSLDRTKALNDEVSDVIGKIDMQNIQRDVRFFYPYEIQVVDEGSAKENEEGSSAHGEYKKAQIRTAMMRIMGSLLNGGG